MENKKREIEKMAKAPANMCLLPVASCLLPVASHINYITVLNRTVSQPPYYAP